MAAQLDLMDFIFGPGGVLSHVMNKPEVRPGQLEVAKHIATALDTGRHIAIEAGTGTGKSLASLVPAAFHAVQNKQRVLVATNTITLQEQLIRKDIPLLREILGDKLEVKTALLKGRRNYISRRKLKDAQQPWFQYPFSSYAVKGMFQKMIKHLNEHGGTQKDDIPFFVSPDVWEPIQSDSESCLGTACPTFHSCHYFQAQREASKAQLLIVNHALLLTDLARRKRGEDGILPSYDVVILDEAHHLEEAATNAFQVNMNMAMFEKASKAVLTLSKVLRSKKKGADRYEAYAEGVLADGTAFLSSIGEPGLVRAPRGDASNLTALRTTIENDIAFFVDGPDRKDEVKAAIQAVRRRLGDMAKQVADWSQQSRPDCAYWVTRDGKGNASAHMAPIEVAPVLEDTLFAPGGPTVIALSATLSETLLRRCGFPEPTIHQVESPFDLKQQALLYLPEHSMVPTQDNVPEYENYLEREILQLVQLTRGRSLILFTSKETMERLFSRLSETLRFLKYTPLKQGGELSRSELVRTFSEDTSSCLFGLLSFWEGVDVPGEACSSVIITRLPFGQPDDPLSVARSERMRAKGKDPFLEMVLPEALVKWRQGFGRLIRKADDRGVVACLDRRLRSTAWGQQFRDALHDVPGYQKAYRVAQLFGTEDILDMNVAVG